MERRLLDKGSPGSLRFGKSKQLEYKAPPIEVMPMSSQPMPYDPETMALRDMFASHALSGMLPAPKVPGVLPMNHDGFAQAAYAYADAMLRARLIPPKAAAVTRT